MSLEGKYQRYRSEERLYIWDRMSKVCSNRADLYSMGRNNICYWSHDLMGKEQNFTVSSC